MAVIRLSESVIFYCYVEKVAAKVLIRRRILYLRQLENDPYRIHVVFVFCNLLRVPVMVFSIFRNSIESKN